MDAKAFRENSNTTNVKLRRTPKVRRHACTARSDFSSEFAMSGGTRMTSIRKRLTLVGASTPILSFGQTKKYFVGGQPHLSVS
jgi:hypothetical protein